MVFDKIKNFLWTVILVIVGGGIVIALVQTSISSLIPATSAPGAPAKLPFGLDAPPPASAETKPAPASAWTRPATAPAPAEIAPAPVQPAPPVVTQHPSPIIRPNAPPPTAATLPVYDPPALPTIRPRQQ